jgi:hypothetical protein
MNLESELRRVFGEEQVIVLVSGGRDYTDDKRINSILDLVHKTLGIELLIEGACPVGDGGADERARKWAKRNEVNSFSVPAKAKKYGWPSCGPKRNEEMGFLGGINKHMDSLWILFPGGRGTESARKVAIAEGYTRLEIGYGGEDKLFEGFKVTKGEDAA